MSTNINLGIDNEKTKEILKLFLNGQAEPAAFDNLVFTGVDVPAYSENEPVVIKVEIKGTVKASLFLRLRDGVEKETGRRTEFKFIIVPGVVDAAMVKEFWPFFSEKTGNTRAWVEMAEPDFKGEKLVVACRGTAHFERIAEAAPRLERCFREFFGVGAVFEPKRAPDDDAAAHRLVSTKYEKADEGENFKSEILTNEEIKGAAVPVESIISAGRYVVEGRIFFDKDFIREIKNRQQEKSYRLSLYITDEKDTLKLFTFASEGDGFISRASSMENARALIDVKFDEREGEITGRLRKIKKLDIDKKRDTAPVKRVELHAHTQMSAMDSIMSVGEYIKTAVRWGHSAAAITDHGVVHAFPEAYNILKKIKDKAGKGGGAEAGLKLIFGVEGYLVERAEKETKAKKPKGEKRKTEKPFHVILLAKNAAGLKNLYKLISLSHIDYFYRKPRIPRKELEAHREGLIVGSACYQGELYQAMLGGAGAEALEKTASFYDYLEIQPVENNRFLIKSGRVKDDECLREHNKTIVELGKKTGKPVAATCDIHFLRKEDRVFREVLMSAQGYDDIDDGGTAVLDFKTTDEMLKEFEYLGAEAAEEVVVKNPRYIASLIEDGLKPVPDKPYPPRIEGADEAIREIIYKNARRIYGDRLNEVIEARIEKELSAIIGNGFAALYYLAKKMVDKSNEDGYIVGSRGSVGSSIAAFFAGISEVNPLPAHYYCRECGVFEAADTELAGIDLPEKKCALCGCKMGRDGFNIPFETFMGFKGDKIPDIDLNFSGEYQDKIHRFIEDFFGSENVFRAGTIVTVQGQAVRKDFIEKYSEKTGKKIKEAEKERLARGCSGVKRSTGQHAGGLMLLPEGKEIYDFTPIQHPPKNEKIITTHFEFGTLHDTLIKVDALGHDVPTSLKRICSALNIRVEDIPLDDPDTMKLFSGVKVIGVDPKNYNPPVGTLGIPEYGTKFTRDMLAATKPSTFSELVYIMGLSHGTDVWKNNAEELIKSKTAVLKEVISVRDDIMNYLIGKGLAKDMAFNITEMVRKGKGLARGQEEDMRKHKVPEWYIDSCRKIGYMFPKAHAVAYAIMSFRIAYIKVHRPEYFYADYFNRELKGFDHGFLSYGIKEANTAKKHLEAAGMRLEKKEKDRLKVLEVLCEMKERGFGFLDVDLYLSDPFLFRVENGSIRPPLSIVPDLGESLAAAFGKEREKSKFSSLEDMIKRTRANKNVVEFIRKNNIAKGIPESDQTALF